VHPHKKPVLPFLLTADPGTLSGDCGEFIGNFFVASGIYRIAIIHLQGGGVKKI